MDAFHDGLVGRRADADIKILDLGPVGVSRWLRKHGAQHLNDPGFLLLLGCRLARHGDECEVRVVDFVAAQKLAEAVADEHRDAVVEAQSLDVDLLDRRGPGAVRRDVDTFDFQVGEHRSRKMKIEREVLPRGDLDGDETDEGTMENHPDRK